MDIQSLQQKLSIFCKGQTDIELVYLFGSYAKGNIGPMSDLDLAILTQKPYSLRKMASLQHKMANLLQISHLDILFLNRASIELAFAVIASGRNIYRKNLATLVEFEAKIASLYCDYLPCLRTQTQDILNECNYEKRIQRYREAFRRTERALGQISPPAAKVSE